MILSSLSKVCNARIKFVMKFKGILLIKILSVGMLFNKMIKISYKFKISFQFSFLIRIMFELLLLLLSFSVKAISSMVDFEMFFSSI